MRKVTEPSQFAGTRYTSGTFIKREIVPGATPIHLPAVVEAAPLTISAVPHSAGFTSLAVTTDQTRECDVLFRQLNSKLPD